VLIHNHPSGDPAPSQTDIKSTARIAKIGEELGILLTDHIIIGENVFYSMREHGQI
jgi:DNA repair protein RadC